MTCPAEYPLSPNFDSLFLHIHNYIRKRLPYQLKCVHCGLISKHCISRIPATAARCWKSCSCQGLPPCGAGCGTALQSRLSSGAPYPSAAVPRTRSRLRSSCGHKGPWYFHIIFLPLYPYTIWRNPYTFRQNPIQFGETIGFCQIVWGFAKLFHFRQIVSDFRQIVYTFWQNNPRTEVHPLPNVKTALKTQKNNVSFRPM